jgi:uncharacterized protein
MANSWHVVHKRVRVGETALGRAVFALRNFRPGQVIGVIQGAVVNDPEYGSEYCMDLGHHRSLEPIAPFRYLNHSCAPNAEIITFTYGPYATDRPSQLFLEAIRPIAPGDEITIDYAWSAECAIPCRCGSTDCRGWVVDVGQLAEVTKERLNAPTGYLEAASAPAISPATERSSSSSGQCRPTPPPPMTTLAR